MNYPPEFINRIRELRALQQPQIKPSPFLKDVYVDEFGVEQPVKLRDYQKIGVMNLLQLEQIVLADDTGLGKAQPNDSLVLTPEGWVKIGDVKVGDRVIGSDGLPTEVLGVYPQGKKQAFRITVSDGSSTECCEDHLWTVRTGNTKRFGDGWRVRSLKQIVAAGIMRQRNSTGLRWEIPVVQPVQFAQADLPIDPYLLGALIGDGSMVEGLNITNGDPEMFEVVRRHLPIDCTYGRTSDDGFTKNIIGIMPGINSLNRALSEINLKGCNWHTKFIPESYLISSVEQRAELLRGLMDTDGYVSKDGKVTQFFSSNGTLVGGFIHLVQSLGGVATITAKNPILRGKSRAKKGRPAFTVTISLPNWLAPFKLPRKVRRWRPRTKYLPSRRIASVVPSRVTECTCIRVESPDSLYVTDQFIITHNTLQVLSAIGYIWLKEPEYVPIIITKKSSLYQWAAETERFMQSMEAVTIDGEPYERHIAYEDFFLGHTTERKRLIIMTYDVLFRDAQESVIRDREQKPDPKANKRLKELRKELRDGKVAFDAEKVKFREKFGRASEVVRDFIRKSLAGESTGPTPSDLAESDLEYIRYAITLRDGLKVKEDQIADLKDVVAPPKKVPGILAMMDELRSRNPNVKFMLVMDEAHVLKNHRSRIHEMAAEAASRSNRTIGMTATPVKNRLMEFFSLFRIVKPGLMPTIKKFHEDFCFIKLQEISKGRKIPIILSYKNLDAFVDLIEPFYLSRRKSEVAKELPQLVSRELICELTEMQQELYDMAEAGLLEARAGDEDATQNMLAAMTMVQQAVDAPALLANEMGEPFEGPSCKEQALIELLEDELDGLKVIVFSKFERMISLIEKSLKAKKIRTTRITGKETKASDREKAKLAFQNPKSGVNVILITTAGSESINLHAAEHIIFVDSPWSWGDYLQLIGRSIRIGSLHIMVVATHLVAVKRDGGKTIDHHVIKTLRTKKVLADKVAGEALKDGLKFVSTNEASDIFKLILDGQKDKKPTLLDEVKKKLASASSKKTKTKVKPELSADPADALALPTIDFSDI